MFWGKPFNLETHLNLFFCGCRNALKAYSSKWVVKMAHLPSPYTLRYKSVFNRASGITFPYFECFHYFYSMSVILIKTDKQNSKILSELAKKLGGDVIDMKEDQFEDFMLGNLMDKVKTGKTVPKDSILKKLGFNA